MRFVDLFAGLGGFHHALSQLGHRCVYACEIDPPLRQLYQSNFGIHSEVVGDDVRQIKSSLPAHDILCAGFPCQPFSKSGNQFGMKDQTRGTLFHEIVEIASRVKPEFLLLENVGNFERHDKGRTWQIVQESLGGIGYNIAGTVHVSSGGSGLISPHHFGYPQTRERFFVVGRYRAPLVSPFPPKTSKSTSLASIAIPAEELTEEERKESELPSHYVSCIEHWNEFLQRLPGSCQLPSFPIWGDEFGATYPFELSTPHHHTRIELLRAMEMQYADFLSKRELLSLLPAYAQSTETHFPRWKIDFIRRNRAWFASIAKYIPKRWIDQLHSFPPSLRKLEWNCQGEQRDLWNHVLQFRPSGLRVKRYASSPALVAMTLSQVPILGPERRFVTRREGLRLQGFPDTHLLPPSHEEAFRALGNAVHVGVVMEIARNFLAHNSSPRLDLVPTRAIAISREAA